MMNHLSVKQTGVVLFLMILALAVVSVNYTLIDAEVQENLRRSPRNFFRNVDTDAKQWLNGHLGVFFRFRYFGNVVWLGLPIMVFLVFTFRSRTPQEMAMLAVLIPMVAVIGVQGSRNARYQFTVFPLLLLLVLVFIWEVLPDCPRWVRPASFILIAALSLFNIGHYLNWYSHIWKVGVVGDADVFPDETIHLLQAARANDPDAMVLVCNQPFYFYYLNGGGIDFRHPGVRKILRRSGDRRKLFYVLRHQFDIRYILYDFRVEATQRAKVFSEIVNLDGRMLLAEGALRLVELRDRPFEETIPPNAIQTLSVWNPDAEDPAHTAPDLQREGHPWKFFLEFERSKAGNELRVVPKKVVKGRKLIECEYRFAWNDLACEEGTAVTLYFVLTARASSGAMGRETYMYIRDFAERREEEKIHFTKSDWRKYLVFKEIKPDVEQVTTGIRFVPRSSSDRLSVRDMKIYVTQHAL